MGRSKVGTRITASHPSYERLIEEALRRAKLLDDDGPTPYLAHVILDYPLTWALARLEELDSILRARTLVATQATHPVCLDCLASYHVSRTPSIGDPRKSRGGAARSALISGATQRGPQVAAIRVGPRPSRPRVLPGWLIEWITAFST
jgi:hypothetical protein